MSDGIFQQWRRLRPAVGRQTHVLAAALLWTLIGLLLLARGLGRLWPQDLWWLPAALLLGTGKSFLILDRSARRGLHRILAFADATCLGAVFAWKSWLLVVLMVGAGLVLRRLSLPDWVLGTALCAVGWALIFSSRHAWRQWFHLRTIR
ncbi:MAG: hypothetical protein BWK76_21055 [Desulfobulbaceae bacterium A2]|nr:MAG: hypothetical protein BWK76_21055 [Desulfobulbaceae bacterium A2]